MADRSGERVPPVMPTMARSRARSIGRALVAAVGLGAGLGLIVAGQRVMARSTDLSVGSVVAWLAGLLIVILLAWRALPRADASAASDVPPVDEAPPPAPHRRDRTLAPRLGGIAAAVLAAGYVAVASWTRPSEQSHVDIVLVWVAAMLLLAASGAPPWMRSGWRQALARAAMHRTEIELIAVVTTVGLTLRILDLDHYPEVFLGDEGEFAMAPRQVFSGALRDPFTTGWSALPTMWFFLEAGMMRLFGDDVAGSRSLMAAVGAATVPLTYIAVRQHLGQATALIAATLTAAFHFCLFLSRVNLHNGTTALFTVLTLALLHRLTRTWGAGAGIATGLTLGLAQFGYFSDRLLVPIAGLYVIVIVAVDRPWRRYGRAAWLRRAGGAIAAAGAGFVVGFLPLAVHYVQRPDTFGARTRLVSILQNGWLDERRAQTGEGTIEVIWHQLVQVALLPFDPRPGGFYIAEAPFVGWALAVPAAVGLAVATAGFWQRRHLGFALAYWLTMASVAFTPPPFQTNRAVMALALLPVFAAIGLVAVGRILSALVRVPRTLVRIGLAAAVVVGVLANVTYYYDDSEPVPRWSDENMMVASLFAYELAGLGPGYTVYYGAAPRMYYRGHLSLDFIAPDEIGIDILQPWTPLVPRPSVADPTVFFLIPERRGELGIVQTWFPVGTLIDRYADDGRLLYTSYRVQPEDVPPLDSDYCPPSICSSASGVG